jgi:magnesium transporter
MINTRSNKNLLWLDVSNPTTLEISEILQKHKLHPLTGEELLNPSSGTKIEFYKDYTLIILTMPIRTRNELKHDIKDSEIDFVISKDFLITARYDTIEQIEYFSKIFEANAILNKDENIDHPGNLFYYIIKRIYRGMRQDLENIRDSIKDAESRVFNGDERRMVETLSNIRRELIDFRQIAKAHHDIWEKLSSHGLSFFGEDYKTYIEDLRDEFEQIHNLITNARELINDLHETNDSLLNSKQNETIKILTLVSFVFAPLTTISAIFTIPAVHVPFIESPYGWNVLVGVMIAIAIFTLYYFRRKGWI